MNDNNKYVCEIGDLDKFLCEELATSFRAGLKTMFSGDSTAATNYLVRFGIDYNNPRVRDAVVFDMVKLDGRQKDTLGDIVDCGGVVNNIEYSFDEDKTLSTQEMERMLLHRNFKVNLMNLEPEWSNITYANSQSGQIVRKRTVEKVFQGLRLSETIIRYFGNVFNNNFDDDGTPKKTTPIIPTPPFTNGADMSVEVALIPNTRIDFPTSASRAYYDTKHDEYKALLDAYGIYAISSFALVDPLHGQNHTGSFLVKVQRKFSDGTYAYIVVTIDKNGKIIINESDEPSNVVFTSNYNEIISVCESDFQKRNVRQAGSEKEEDYWRTATGEIPMVKSTTSSQYSIFSQYIPDNELEYVRQYIQFNNRLSGMKFYLEYIDRDIERKEKNCSECFINCAFAIRDLMVEFNKQRYVLSLVSQFYEKMHEFDQLVDQKSRIRSSIQDKNTLLDELISKYQNTPNSQMNKKIELGQKIQSLKLELSHNLCSVEQDIFDRLVVVRQQIEDFRTQIANAQTSDGGRFGLTEKEFSQLTNSLNLEVSTELQNKSNELNNLLQNVTKKVNDLYSQAQEQITAQSERGTLIQGRASDDSSNASQEGDDDYIQDLSSDIIDTSSLENLVIESEKWRGYMFNLGYELDQLKKIRVKCSDATIQVNRLVHNFKERILDTESQVFDENHKLKKDFSFTSISSSGIRDIILLFDWYACNAGNYYWQTMGFSSVKEFIKFRKECNKKSLHIRQNQYAQILDKKKMNLSDLITTLRGKIQGRHILQYDDKYGMESKIDADSDKKWNKSNVTKQQRSYIGVFSKAYQSIKDIVTQKHIIPKVEKVDLNEPEQIKKQGDIHKEDVLVEFNQISNNDIDEQPRRLENIITEKNNILDFGQYIKAEDRISEDEKVELQFQQDSQLMYQRTIEYLINIGMIETEDDLEKLVIRSNSNNESILSVQESLDALHELESLKTTLDKSISIMNGFRDGIQDIIQSVDEAEAKICELSNENIRIFNQCLVEKNRNIRNKLLLKKLDNEGLVVDLQALVQRTRSDHQNDLDKLRRFRDKVDANQKEYDDAVTKFKDRICVNEDTIDSLVVQIYNSYQNEILGRD